jgi:hypothetical protein
MKGTKSINSGSRKVAANYIKTLYFWYYIDPSRCGLTSPVVDRKNYAGTVSCHVPGQIPRNSTHGV